ERGADAERAVLHGLADERLHRFGFGRIGRALGHSFHVLTNGGGADEGSDVNRRAVFVHGAEPGVEAVSSGEVLAARAAQIALSGESLLIRGRIGAAFAEDLGGDALRDLTDDTA